MIILNAPSLYDHREPIPYTCTNSTDFFKLPGYKPEDEEFVRRFICRGHSFVKWIMSPVGFFDIVPALPCPWFSTCKLLFLTRIHVQRRRPEVKKHVSSYPVPVFIFTEKVRRAEVVWEQSDIARSLFPVNYSDSKTFLHWGEWRNTSNYIQQQFIALIPAYQGPCVFCKWPVRDTVPPYVAVYVMTFFIT